MRRVAEETFPMPWPQWALDVSAGYRVYFSYDYLCVNVLTTRRWVTTRRNAQSRPTVKPLSSYIVLENPYAVLNCLVHRMVQFQFIVKYAIILHRLHRILTFLLPQISRESPSLL